MFQWQGARRNGCFRRLASVPDTKKLPQTQYDIKVRVTCMHMLQESGWFCQSLLPLDRPKIYVLLSTFILFISKVVRVIKLGECSRPVTHSSTSADQQNLLSKCPSLVQQSMLNIHVVC